MAAPARGADGSMWRLARVTQRWSAVYEALVSMRRQTTAASPCFEASTA